MTDIVSSRITELISFKDTKGGLGIKLVGGKQGTDNFGIFVKGLISNGLAAKDGSLKLGDQLVSVNGIDFTGISNQRATELLRQCSSTGRGSRVKHSGRGGRRDLRRRRARTAAHVFGVVRRSAPTRKRGPNGARPFVT